MGQERYRIGRLAADFGPHRKTLRYYERRGLLAPAARTATGYRRYTSVERDTLRFIIGAEAPGPTPAEIGDIPSLHRDGQEPCTHVRTMLERTLLAVEAQLRALAAFPDGLLVPRDAATATAACGGEVCGIAERPVPGRQPDAAPTV